MCTVCGCGADEAKIEGGEHAHTHVHADGTVHTHHHGDDHEHTHSHDHAPDGAHSHVHRHANGSTHVHEHVHQGEHDHDHGDLDYGAGPARAHVPGLSQTRMVQIEQDILSKNNAHAAKNRACFDERGIFALNLVSGPGSGKTTLLVETIKRLKDRVAIAVVEGDQQTANDAERIRATGVPALQINTGKGCHLDGHMVGHAIERLAPAEESLFLIENVGNLVCPAAFALGEHHKVAILSVTEGEDKPLKYPDMFRAADVLLLNKCDLLPYLAFDADLAEANARRVNPRLTVFRVSATQGDGMEAWLAWLTAGLEAQRAKRNETVTALKARVAELERQLAGH
ncbi:MAG: hydrogenase nickel incorporation protein HypB [Betaproteobacteria bacterium]|nr:hydrogenase nickel incorporation protein HypB [Betaproteobacteria bacterium]MCL2886497.1 hydrogenase nickel incorporation protein HypB [Betaproteobacteria bacterium]